MTSVEIAELVESRHAEVRRSIERLAKRGVIKLPPTAKVSTGLRGPGSKVYLFTAANKRDSFVVVAQLSPEFTARIVDRWQELEAQAKEFTAWKVARRAAADRYITQVNAIEQYGEEQQLLPEEILKMKKREANRVSTMVLGMHPSNLANWFDEFVGQPYREAIPSKLLEAIEFLERHNAMFIQEGLPDNNRQNLLTAYLKAEYPEVHRFSNDQQNRLLERERTNDFSIRPVNPLEVKALTTQ